MKLHVMEHIYIIVLQLTQQLMLIGDEFYWDLFIRLGIHVGDQT